MKHGTEDQDLFKACRIIFGPDLTFSQEFLQYIQMTGVKSAFRRRAMESHPDRMRCQTDPGNEHPEHTFPAVKDAYETLCAYLQSRDRRNNSAHRSGLRSSCPGTAGYHGFGKNYRREDCANRRSGKSACRERNQFRHSVSRKSRPFSADYRGLEQRRDRLRRGGPPKRRLLFGHYLYYLGVIDWHSLVKALIWQRRQRYRIGELARRKGWLTSRDVHYILDCSQATRTFGQEARSLGLLTDKQVAYLLCQQKKKQKKIGEYFLEKNLLNRKQLAELLLSFHRHNELHERRPSF